MHWFPLMPSIAILLSFFFESTQKWKCVLKTRRKNIFFFVFLFLIVLNDRFFLNWMYNFFHFFPFFFYFKLTKVVICICPHNFFFFVNKSHRILKKMWHKIICFFLKGKFMIYIMSNWLVFFFFFHFFFVLVYFPKNINNDTN